MSILWSVLGVLSVLALTLAAALFVAAEFSLTTLERSQIDAHVNAVGDRRAHQVRRAHRTLSFQLSGAQLGITLTTLATGYIAEPALGRLMEGPLAALGLPEGLVPVVAVTLALAVATALSVVLGELVPKNLAIARPLPTARAVAGAQAMFSQVFRWLINWLNSSANWIVRSLGVEPAEELRSARSPDELRSLVSSSAEHGTLDAGTATLLARAIRFTDRVAEDLMTPRVQVQALPADATLPDLIATSLRTGFSRFPVYHRDLDEIRGVVHVKQAFAVPVPERPDTTMAQLARPVLTVPDSLDGDALLTRLRGSDSQLAVVVDEYGGTAGIVTMEDMVEEIVGDVRDEHDPASPAPIRPLGQDSWLVSGLLRTDELAEATGFAPPEGDYETLAGLVLERLGRIPDVGDDVEVDGWRLTVMRRERNRIAELRLSHAGPRAADRPEVA
ncbi:hemolysin family protein [Pseudonocardia eucalypti]|uniref:Hemolysin family protein n=1 Tax=Pseudonocardia eucalypti TaxID=648755 RepID=A0ABP9RDK5_9PSEU|nr:CBS domain containing-hemolysin-like protein [Pseudonocardia eucalypti]